MNEQALGRARPDEGYLGINGRIHALDIIRGLALLGIALMNVEWFTRPMGDFGSGADPSQSGIHYAASWLVYALVQGKFVALFSLLFGMGFAVMLGRAEAQERPFVAPYLRRILALFLFGAAHYVLIWTGDILQSYAFAALALLLVVTRAWKSWGMLLLAMGLTAALTRNESAVTVGVLLLLTGLLMFVLNRGTLARYWKWGAVLFALPFVIAIALASVQSVKKLAGTAEPPAAEDVQQRLESQAEDRQARVEEIRILGSGTYGEALAYRVGLYVEELPIAIGGSFGALPMFLIGFWFIRAGVMSAIEAQRAVFRRLLTRVLPIGLALTAISVGLYSHFGPAPPEGRDPVQWLAGAMFQLGTVPTALGYFGALVLLLQTRWGQRALAPLRHAGRMALSNYIGMSLVGTWFFYGYGLGYYGQLGRASQVLFVLVVFALQVLLSRWWLQRFRYGPLEWTWRAFTHWTLPAMRRQASSSSSEASRVAAG